MMRSPIARVARLRSYDEALKFMQKTAQTRGTNYVPLGDRRYHADYNVERVVTADSDKIVVNLFKQPLIEFVRGTDVVTVNPMGWGIHTASCDMLSMVLALKCSTATKGKFVLYVNAVEEGKNLYSQKVVLPSRSKFYLVPSLGNWNLLEKPVMFTHHINKRETNIVRESTRKFREHIELMLKVRDTLHVEEGMRGFGSKDFPIYLFRRDEYDHTFGPHPENPKYTAIGGWSILLRKPTSSQSLATLVHKAFPIGMRSFVGLEKHMTEWEFYRSRSQEFMQMVTSDDPEKYYKALLILAFCTAQGNFRNLAQGYERDTMPASLIDMLETFDEIILKANSNKCFRIVEAEQGVVPTDKYESYVFWGD
jgi:hypothetical protein